MAKVLFVFAGTGDTATNISRDDGRLGFADNVVRVYFNGCQDKAVGGSYIFGKLSPDLDVAGAKVRRCFNHEGQLRLVDLKEKFGTSIIIHPTVTEDVVPVESINLTGFSRGAVTTFSVARHLNDLGKPIKIFASDPVPGESIEDARKEGSQFSKNYDLTQCRNIRRAEIVIGGYRSSVNMAHDIYFRQMAPRFNSECESHTYSFPKKNHLSSAGAILNQEMRFLRETGFTNGRSTLRYVEDGDSMFFTPKVLAQAHHAQEAMNLELLPIYREKLCAKLAATYGEPRRFNDQTLQALFALQKLNKPSSVKSAVEVSILNDQTDKGNALRDFVIEFENVNQHALRKSPKEKKDAPKADSPHLDTPAMNKYRESVYKQLMDLPLLPKPEDKLKFIKTITDSMKELKAELPEKKYAELKKVTKSLLSTHNLLTTDFRVSMQTDKANAAAMASLSETATADDLIRRQKDLKSALQAMSDPPKPAEAEECGEKWAEKARPTN